MSLETTPFDPAKYLKTPDAIDEYLVAAFETGDPVFVVESLGVVARSHGMTQLAKETGLHRQTLYKALSAEGNPEFGTVMKIARGLGYDLAPVRRPTAA